LLAYGVSAVSGTVLAVCSCTVLPLFAGIYKRGAGLGPATAFLYSGPAINALAIILTARLLGFDLGLARALGAVLFSVVIGVSMHLLFLREETDRDSTPVQQVDGVPEKPLWLNGLFFAVMVLILVFANWAEPDSSGGIWRVLFDYKWEAVSSAAVVLGIILARWYGLRWWKISGVAAIVLISWAAFRGQPLVPFIAGTIGLAIAAATEEGEPGEWFESSWGFARQILPLLLLGVLAAGLLLGRPGGQGLIPSTWIAGAVGGNSLGANLFASVAGAFMYFATLTEVPILLGLVQNGMGKGPALALLLAGPALSLPNMLVISSVLGWKKTSAYVVLVIVMATVSGMIFGAVIGG
jgi:uncharacterized membrane protein YraQ (UPF0718 family)